VFQAFTHLQKQNSDGLYPNFAHDLPTSKLAELSDVSRPTIKQLLFKLRTRIAQLFCNASPPFSGEVEVDEPNFGARRVRGKKGRGAGGKAIVFGILERHGIRLHGNRPERHQEAATGRNPGPGGPWPHHPLGRLDGLTV